jgi:hypothetical protein|nr:DUF4350 domain-containing protein [Candidatus Krumholzibacteria bacterium]
MTQGVFSSRTLLLLVGLCSLSLVVGLVVGIFQEEIGGVRSSGADAFSYSALGHRGFTRLLEESGVPVLVSRSNSGAKAGPEGLLLVAEPDLISQGFLREQKFLEMLAGRAATLVVLPKRTGAQDPGNPAHLASVTDLPTTQTQVVMDALGVTGTLVRNVGHTRDLSWGQRAWPGRPFIDDVQLVDSLNLEPLLASEHGILLGRVKEDPFHPENYVGGVFVLSDPDLMANHGLGLGQNASIMLKIINDLRGPEGVVVLDETLHGHEVSPSVFRSLFRVPLVFVLMQLLVVGGMLLWLANGRFGSPGAVPSSRKQGLDFLLDNTAELLEYGGHGPFVLGRYHRAATAAVCRRLHLDLPVSSPAARKRLMNITAVRSPSFKFAKIESQVPATAADKDARSQRVLALARAIHRWQQEMTHGL